MTIAILVTLTGAVPCLGAGDHIGIVKSAAGDVYIVRDGKTIDAEVGVKVMRADLVGTGPKGSVGMIFEDDTVISMGPQSTIIIEDYLFEPAEKKLFFVTRIIKGTLAYLSGQIAKLAPEMVLVETPDATIGMRGTQVLVKVDAK